MGMMHSSGSIELRHFGLPLCEWDLCPSRMLSSIDGKLVIDVSGQSIEPIFRGQTYSLNLLDETDWLYRNLCN